MATAASTWRPGTPPGIASGDGRWRSPRYLFGVWIVQVNFGRIGSAGRTFARSFADHLTAGRYVRAAIARRHSAPRRIGVAYRVIADDGTLA